MAKKTGVLKRKWKTPRTNAESYEQRLLGRRDFWELTIGIWGVLEDGVNPFSYDGFDRKIWSTPGCYILRSLHFTNPPSRADFLTLVARLPWAQSAFDDFIRLYMPISQWPILDGHLKRTESDILDSNGRKIGTIRVSRTDAYDNGPYGMPNFFTTSHKKFDREIMYAFENLIRERIVQVYPQTDEAKEDIIRRTLAEIRGAK